MIDFDYGKFNELKSMLKRAQFVPVDPQAAGGPPPGMDPGAGGPPPEGMPPPGPEGMPPGDPAAMGMPPGMDPAMMAGMPPPDMGMPPPPGDPAAMGMPPLEGGGDVSPTGEPYMKITPTQLSKLFKQFAEVFKSVLGIQSPAGGQAVAQAAPAANQQQDAQLAELNAKLDALIHG